MLCGGSSICSDSDSASVSDAEPDSGSWTWTDSLLLVAGEFFVEICSASSAVSPAWASVPEVLGQIGEEVPVGPPAAG